MGFIYLPSNSQICCVQKGTDWIICLVGCWGKFRDCCQGVWGEQVLCQGEFSGERHSGLTVRPVLSSHLGLVDFPGRQVTCHLSLSHSARTQARCLPTKWKRKLTKTYPARTKFKSRLFKGQVGTQVFSSPADPSILWAKLHSIMLISRHLAVFY